jgi:parvulin-like peptidyl-prolyl isomerase
VAALQTPAGQVAEPVRADGGVYVVKTLERAAAAADGFEKERVELEKQVLEQKRTLVWDNWIRDRLASSKVQVSGQPTTLTR